METGSAEYSGYTIFKKGPSSYAALLSDAFKVGEKVGVQTSGVDAGYVHLIVVPWENRSFHYNADKGSQEVYNWQPRKVLDNGNSYPCVTLPAHLPLPKEGREREVKRIVFENEKKVELVWKKVL